MDLTVDDTNTISDENANKPIRSWSQFSTYMRCPEMYRVKYVDKTLPRSSNSNMHAGSAVHMAHEKLSEEKRDNGTIMALEDVIAHAEKYWDDGKDALDEPPMELALTRAKMVNCVESYYHYFVSNDINPTHIEESVIIYPKGYPFGLRGIIDRIDEGNVLVDLKTSSKSPPKSKATGAYYLQQGTGYDMQLDTYILLMREGLNLDPRRASLEFVVKSKVPKVVRVEHDIRDDRVDSILDLMANLEESIQKGNFPKNRLGTFCSPRMCENWVPCTGISIEPDVLIV